MPPARGEIWLVDLDPVVGHEQAGFRPALIFSTNEFNRGPVGLVVAVPLTTTRRNVPLHIEIEPPEGGVDRTSFIKCEDVRSISVRRLRRRLGVVSPRTLSLVADGIRIMLDL